MQTQQEILKRFIFFRMERCWKQQAVFFVEFDENSTLHQNGIFSLEFIPKFEGNYTLLPMVIDSFGVQKFSTETIHMEVRKPVLLLLRYL